MAQENPMAGPLAPAPEHQFYSLGFLCQMLQKLPPHIEAIATAAGVTPCMAVDGVVFFRGSDVQAMAEHVAKFRERVETTVKSN